MKSTILRSRSWLSASKTFGTNGLGQCRLVSWKVFETNSSKNWRLESVRQCQDSSCPKIWDLCPCHPALYTRRMTDMTCKLKGRVILQMQLRIACLFLPRKRYVGDKIGALLCLQTCSSYDDKKKAVKCMKKEIDGPLGKCVSSRL